MRPARFPRARLVLVLGFAGLLLVACTSVRRLDPSSQEGLALSPTPVPSASIYVPHSPVPGAHRSASPPPYGAAPIAPVDPNEPPPGTTPRGSLDQTDSGVISEGAAGVVPCGRETLETVSGVDVSETWECYDITGATVGALRRQTAKLGPKVDGTHAVAATAWALKWAFTTVQTPDGCELTAPHATVTITYHYPRVTNTKPERTITDWGTFMREDVIPHEETHGTIAVAGGKKVVSTLTRLDTSKTCSTTTKQANDAARQVHEETSAKQDAFDQREAHQ